MQVIDASLVIAALVDPGHDGAWAEAALEATELAAPWLMHYEAANVLRKAVARGELDPSAGAAALSRLMRLAVTALPFEFTAQRAWELRDNLTSYDAAYVAAAELLGCRLVTLDERLSRASGPRCEIVTPG